MHAVFDINPDSKYRPDFWCRYAIPTRTAVPAAWACLHDWVVFRHTGTRGYIAIGRVDDVIPDPQRPGFSVALISDYLPFTAPVPFKVRGRYAEQDLRLVGRSIRIGQAVQGKPIRKLWPSDFGAITQAGFSRTIKMSGANVAITREPNGFEDEVTATLEWEPAPRLIEELFVRRPFRDANFRVEVCGPYGYKCAFTRLSLSDGKLYEVDAAHMLSVEEHGPDIMQNGVCVSKTPHWAFDHHLISIDEMYRPMIAPGALPDEYIKLFPPAGEMIHLPENPSQWPAKIFLDRHRAIFRKKHGIKFAAD